MERPYANVDSIISPAQFDKHGFAADIESHASVMHTAQVDLDPSGRYKATGTAHDRRGYDEAVRQPFSYRTPLRAKVAAVHAAREAVHRLGYTN